MARRAFDMVVRGLHAFAVLSAFAASTAACVAADPGDDALVEPEAFTRTMVRLHEDGSADIEVVTISAEEQILDGEMAANGREPGPERVGTASQAITKDAGCASSSIHLFDQANFTGNEICFFGAGIVNLNNYCRNGGSICDIMSGRWGQHVRSYKTGSQWGRFSIDQYFTCAMSACAGFYENQLHSSVSSCEQTARYIGIQEVCVP